MVDDKTVSKMNAGDLVITGDILLAAEVQVRCTHVLSPRGEFYCQNIIAQTLTLRDFMDNLRASGIQTGGPPPLHSRDVQQFAKLLDKFLARIAAK